VRIDLRLKAPHRDAGKIMIRKTVAAIVLIPLAILIVLLALANRQRVTISFDPFLWEKPALAVTLPLFVIILLALLAGVVIGGVAAWLRQRKWRRTARHAQAEAAHLRAEAEALKERLEAAERAARPSAISYHRPPAA
jgi:uncharacterized integral membrane protein